jgi:hypothetical protein
MYVFKFEPEIALLTVTKTGLWSTGTVASYEVLVREQLECLKNCAPSTLCVVDIRSQGAQPRVVADALRAMVARLGPLNATRTAVVSSSGIAKLQAIRVADMNAQVFTSMVVARDWLMGKLQSGGPSGLVYDEASEAEAEGRSVHLHGPSGVDVNLTPAAAFETAERIGTAAVDAVMASAGPPSQPPSVLRRS